AVLVEGGPAGAASIHFGDIIFLAAAGKDNRSHSGLPRDVGEDNGRRRRHRKSNQQGQAAEKKETKERRRLHGGSGDRPASEAANSFSRSCWKIRVCSAACSGSCKRV